MARTPTFAEGEGGGEGEGQGESCTRFLSIFSNTRNKVTPLPPFLHTRQKAHKAFVGGHPVIIPLIDRWQGGLKF